MEHTQMCTINENKYEKHTFNPIPERYFDFDICTTCCYCLGCVCAAKHAYYVGKERKERKEKRGERISNAMKMDEENETATNFVKKQ